jgi:hypothetical protein
MLIDTITFQIHDFTNHTTEEFLVENTEDNLVMINEHRFTRAIKFGKTFAFQYAREMKMPIEFISNDTWVRMVNSYPEMFATVADLESV